MSLHGSFGMECACVFCSFQIYGKVERLLALTPRRPQNFQLLKWHTGRFCQLHVSVEISGRAVKVVHWHDRDCGVWSWLLGLQQSWDLAQQKVSQSFQLQTQCTMNCCDLTDISSENSVSFWGWPMSWYSSSGCGIYPMKYPGIRSTPGSRYTKLSNPKVFLCGPRKSSSQSRLLLSGFFS